MIRTLSPEGQHSLMSADTSRQNKLWLVTGWIRDGWWIEWKWLGKPMASRMAFRFSPDSEFVKAKSYDEDVFTKLKGPKKVKDVINNE